MLPLDKMADQNVPRYQQINVWDFVNFFLKSGIFTMEGERCALCNWWSDVVKTHLHFLPGAAELKLDVIDPIIL